MHIWLGRVDISYILNQWVVLFICLNFYIDTSCQLDNVFRNASGHFKIGRYLQIWGGLLNVALAVSLCHFYGLTGIFAAQVLSKLFTSYFPFIMNVQKVVFGLQSKDGNDCMGKAIFASHWDWHDYMVVVFAYSRDNSPQFVFEGVITLVFTVAVLWMVFL